jgi:hypothetical protein
MVHRPLLEGVAHELPPGFVGGAGDPFVILADARVDRQRRPNAEPAEQLEEAPDADAHTVFVP